MSGNPMDMLKDTALNFATGGLYSIYKAATSDHPLNALMAQGLDVGMAAVGNQLAVDMGGPLAGTAFNAAGGLAGAAGGAGLFAGTAAAEGAPTAAALSEAGTVASGGAVAEGAAIPVASGVAPTTAETAAVGLEGPIGATAAPAAESTAPGGLSTMVGAGSGEGVGGAPLTGLASTGANTADASALQELKGAATGLDKAASAKSWFESLSPGAQTALVTGGFAGAQMLTGGMQGLFTGVSAQKRLELDQLINSQYQNQIQYKNKNNQYAPLLTFKAPPTGLATAGA